MLYQHQQKFIDENPDKTALVRSCGTGQTRAACEWAKQRTGLGGITLIICPKSLKANWQRECEKWKLYAYKVMTKEEFRKDYKTLIGLNQVICDEVHNGFLTPNFKSQMSKALRSYLKVHKVERVLL